MARKVHQAGIRIQMPGIVSMPADISWQHAATAAAEMFAAVPDAASALIHPPTSLPFYELVSSHTQYTLTAYRAF